MKRRFLAVALVAVMAGSLLGSGSLTAAAEENEVVIEEVEEASSVSEDTEDEGADASSEENEAEEEADASEETEAAEEDTSVTEESVSEESDETEETTTDITIETDETSADEAEASEAADEEVASDEAAAVSEEAGEETVSEEGALSEEAADAEETAATTITSTGGELSGGRYILEEDVTLATNLTVPSGATVTIDLNGYTLTGKTKSSTTSVITVYGTLTITDSSEGASGVITNETNRGTKNSSKYYGAGVYVAEGGSLTLKAGTISESGSTSSSYGGGVCVYGTFTMSGGSVSGNTATYGGGVYVAAGASFTMSGGSVSNNTAGYGGGVYAASGAMVAMSGSSAISGNTASSGNGGGAFLQSSVTFTMSDSSAVSGNTAAKAGGGISCKADGTTITMSDSSAIRDNTASSGNGGGIYLSGTNGGNKIEIEGGSIVNNEATGGSTIQGGGIYAAGSVTLTISGGSISKNTVESTTSTCYGGGIYMGSGSFTMSGGEVVGNEAAARNKSATEEGDFDCSYGGGISFGGRCTATISGGTISSNTANRGGGVCVYKASLTLKGGTICSNTASVYGGGVYTQGDGSTYTFVMTGGSVCNNKAGQSGGGICLFSGDDASNVVYAGTITGNVTTGGHGGGIYVNTQHTVTLYNVVITENTASILGGGIWACNTGGIEVYVTEGGAVYGNDATGTDGKTSSQAGDDIASVTKKESVEYVLSLASRILGGGAAAWYEDGGVSTETATNTGTADTSAARYSEDSEEVENPEATTDSYALKDVATGTALAVAEATTVISGNSAPRGGGIGANGNVIIGNSSATTTSVTVTKVWDDSEDAEGARPDSVTVYLYNTLTTTDEDGVETKTKYLIDTATLCEDNDWIYDFDELPVDEDYSYSVEEEAVDDYIPSYSTVTNKDETLSVTITNEYDGRGSIIVSKTVSGTGASTTEAFSFTMTLSDTSINGTYGELEFTNGVASFKLKAGENVTASDLPAGVDYEVTESGNEGYTVTTAGESGTIEAGKTAYVYFNNYKAAAATTTTTTTTTKSSSGSSSSSSSTSTVSSVATGDSTNIVLWLALTAMAVAAGASVTLLYKKRRV